MKSIRDIYTKIRKYSAQTTTKTLPIFFLEKYELDNDINNEANTKREMLKLKINASFVEKMQDQGHITTLEADFDHNNSERPLTRLDSCQTGVMRVL